MPKPALKALLRPQLATLKTAIADSRGAAAVGAASAGALAIGAAAIGRLAVKSAAVKRLEIDELVVRRLQVDAHGAVTRAAVDEWVAGYERAWRTAGTAPLAALFTPEATYSPGPYEPTVRGLAAIGDFWEHGRESADEVFSLRAETVAVDGRAAVVRTEVAYEIPAQREYRNLWLLRFADDGRVEAFEEWPFHPERRVTATPSDRTAPKD
jgi:hypothetical protein